MQTTSSIARSTTSSRKREHVERLRDVCPHSDAKVREDLEKSVKYDILGRLATKDSATLLEEPGSSF